MANSWTGKKVDKSNINDGVEYTAGVDIVGADDVNAAINNSLYAADFVDFFGTNIDTAGVNNVGTPTVELVNRSDGTRTFKMLKFANLKGEKGATGNNGTNGANGKNALVLYSTINMGVVPTINYSISGIERSNFSRTPEYNEKLNVFYKVTDTNRIFLCDCVVTSVNNVSTTTLRIENFIEFTGTKGEDGISITSATLTKV